MTAVVDLSGESIELRAERAIHWPSESTLFVADLHLGKDESLRAGGAPLPSGSLASDLARLGALIHETGAQRLVVAGDLIHAKSGLTERVIEQVAAWRAEHDIGFVLVPGNHDRTIERFANAWDVSVAESSADFGPFTVVHDPQPVSGRSVIAGHIHPAVVLRMRPSRRRFAGGGGAPLKLPCFWMQDGVCVLPAFSTFTGGAAIERSGSDRVFAIAEGTVCEV